MRHIKYIIINDSMPEASRGKSSNIRIDNLGYHYVINSQGEVLNPIDVSNPANLTLETRNLKPETKHLKPRGIERLNACSIGIKYNGSLKREACNLKLRVLLLALLNELRSSYPEAAILALNEIKPGTRCFIRVRDDMNALRRELSSITG
ncbi:hypothetical protein L6470_00855 [Prevotella communis]|uniref:hypothetical protein n=1 Tax=Prevotella communis TaxID=2913614 RepID=UPI001EDA1B7F|nr:hypothetical protein [Prevotella communis]UKK59594.1 hypothetical protein L6470_00855 [Prevotella communis]